MTCPAIDWSKFSPDEDWETEEAGLTPAPASPQASARPRRFVFPKSTIGGAARISDAEPLTRDIPEGESFSNADAAAIGLRLMNRTSKLPIVEADIGSDL